MKKFIVIGDSHVRQFMGQNFLVYVTTKQDPSWNPFWLFGIGPATCWNFADKYKKETSDILNEHWHAGDHVLFSLGEIDCRCHVVKQAQIQKRPIFEMAREVANRYLSIASQFNSFSPVLLGLPPQLREKGQGGEGIWTPVGTRQERNEATDTFNDALKSSGRTFWIIQRPDLMPDSIHVSGEEARQHYLALAKTI